MNAIADKLNRLARQESAFLSSTFLAPVLRNRPVTVRIAGVVFTLSVRKDWQGWGVFKPKSFEFANFVRNATMAEREEYLKLFPKLRLILCRNVEGQWFGVPAGNADGRFRVTGLVPVRLPEEVQLFDQVVTRFDGKECWFDRIDPNVSGRNAENHREFLANWAKPVQYNTAVSQLLIAYQIAYDDLQEAKRIKTEQERQKYLATTEGRIKDALGRAGAEYRSHVDRGDTWTVEYRVGGEVHKSTVSKDGLNVVSAGICLTDHRTGKKTDSVYDLGSLVSVMREGQNRGKIVRVGDNQTDNDSWDD